MVTCFFTNLFYLNPNLFYGTNLRDQDNDCRSDILFLGTASQTGIGCWTTISFSRSHLVFYSFSCN